MIEGGYGDLHTIEGGSCDYHVTHYTPSIVRSVLDGTAPCSCGSHTAVSYRTPRYTGD